MIFRHSTCAAFLAAIMAAIVAHPLPAATQNAAPPKTDSSEAPPQFAVSNYSAAISALRDRVAKNPQDAEAYYWLCRSYYEAHDLDNAIAECEQAVRLAPQNSDYHLWLGEAYGEKADRERSFLLARKVKAQFEEAVRLNPRNIRARRDLAQFYAEAPWIVGGSKDGAKQQVDAIAAMDPVQGHLARAQYWADQKRNDLAENEVRQALTAKPSNPDVLFEIADFYAALGRASELKAVVDAAAALRPNDPRLSYYRGIGGVLAKGAMGPAEQSLKSYLASTPERSDWPSHAAAREWLGRAYEAEGKRQQAAEQYRAALQLEPGRDSASARLKHLEQGTK
jgi:cytochrome c-type biogenesis protein CcmH/NrfG